MFYPFGVAKKRNLRGRGLGAIALDPRRFDFGLFIANIRFSISYWWYRLRYNIKIGGWEWDSTMRPSTGKGNYVDVLVKGPFIDIVDHSSDRHPRGTIRLIPCQPNHGVMVEYLTPSGKVAWRVNCDYTKFYKMGFSAGESLEAPKKDATLIEIDKNVT